jgi:hypothetical protein
MINKIIKPIIGKIKVVYPTIRPYIKFGAIGGLILFLIAISDKWEKIETNRSYRDSILHEINIARNTLDYTLAQRSQNIRNRAVFSLNHEKHIADSFSGNLQLKTELTDLYRALSSAQKSAEELMSLLSQSNSSKQTIQNRENDIKRAIKLADEVGPNVAEFVGGSWLIPPPNLSPGQRVKFYEEKTQIIYSVATDSEVESRWQKKNK